MAGKVISRLRESELAQALSEAELRLVAGSSRREMVAAGDQILQSDGHDERLFVLIKGRVALNLTMWSEAGVCGGEATAELSSPGAVFGWAFWAQPERIAVSARAIEPSRLLAIRLESLGDTQVFSKITTLMLRALYAHLQESGLCPPNVQALLKMKRLLQVS